MNEILKLNLLNLLGKESNHKFIIFDSDDWGTIRVPNKKIKEKLMSEKIYQEFNPYDEYDAIEGEDDLLALFEVLSEFRDNNGNNPVFTLNTVMCNPDFEKIRESRFSEYIAETFKETYARYWGKDLMNLWDQGINDKLIYPQFHAREHLNVNLWMDALQMGYKDVHKCFELGYFALSGKTPSKNHNHYLAAFHNTSLEDINNKMKVLTEGLERFKSIFGFNSFSFVPCNYIWNDGIESAAYDMSVRVLKGQRAQLKPDLKDGSIKPVYHYNGQLSRTGHSYLVRNVIFEPSTNQHIDWVAKCIKEIGNAFFWKQPAVISSHRVNYIGSIDENNRKQSLDSLKMLLNSILKKWPDVEFIHSGKQVYKI